MLPSVQNNLVTLQKNLINLAFIPHGHCYLWQPGLVWLHALSDGLTALAYFSIPIALIYFVRQRRDLPYPQVFLLFGAFIIACGLTHVMEIWTLWHPIYWVSGALKAITAIASLITASALVPIIPQALMIPSRSELEAAKQELEQQVRDRGQALQASEERWQLALRDNNNGISQLKQTETELQKMTEVVEYAISGISRLDAQGRYLYVNKAYADLAGYLPEEMIGMSWQRTVHPDDLEQVSNAYQQMVQNGKVEVEARGIRKDGSRFYKQLFMVSNYDKHQQFVGHYCFLKDTSDRKQAEANLEKELLRSRTLFNISIDGIVILDHQGNVAQTSSRFVEMLGYTVEETLQLNVVDWDAQWTREELQQILKQAIELPPVFETRHRRKDGSIYDTEISYSRIVLDGEMMHFCICRDISERKRSEAKRQQTESALQESEKRLQLALEASGDGLWDWNIVTGEVYYSPQYMTMLGFAADELPQNFETWKYLTHPDDQAWVLDILNAHMRDSSQQYSFDYRVRTKSGHWKWIADYGKVVAHDSQGKPLRMIGTHQDISDRKQAETELKHQKDMLQAIVNHIPVMIALFDSNGHIEFVNSELERTLGWSLADWQHQDAIALCYPDAAYCQSVKEFMLAATGKWQDMITLTASGQSLETSWTNVRLSSGQLLGIGQDISDRKRKEIALKQAMEAAEAANLAKSMFLANMSHELRTPLNVILGFAQVMGHDSSLTPTQRADLQTIQRSGDHLLSLINDVLDLSKIEAGHCTLEASGFDLISLLHTLRTMMAKRAKAEHLQLTFEIASEVPQFVIADEQKLRQVLLNLLSNAIKFTKQGQVKLAVSIARHSSSVIRHSRIHDQEQITHDYGLMPNSPNSITLQFEISDTGVGIAATEQAAIFDAFIQAEAGRKSIGGTGLGLTISRKLLELMDGSISVESTPEVGSTFTVTVPVCPTSRVNGQVEQRERTVIGLVPGQPHRQILVVDDQPENRTLIVRLLTRLGLEVQEAANGQEAIALWQHWKPDLIWMDIRMPGLDGYEATKQIRAMEQEAASIIIALTAQASHSDRAFALAAGCNDYISKPLREETLFLKLKEYLGLEYLYAESETPLSSSSPSSPDTNDDRLSFDPTILAQVPADWLKTLENLAICGNDRAIVDLVNQLAPEFDNFKAQLLDLTNRFEFEQIVHLIHRDSSS